MRGIVTAGLGRGNFSDRLEDGDRRPRHAGDADCAGRRLPCFGELVLAEGLFRTILGPDKWGIRCPWAVEHSRPVTASQNKEEE
jgi:hypothetical protein